MSHRLKAIYTNGTFVPLPGERPLDVPDNAEVEITVHDRYTMPPTVADGEERARLLRELIERMRANPLPADAPRFTRDELHERR